MSFPGQSLEVFLLSTERLRRISMMACRGRSLRQKAVQIIKAEFYELHRAEIELQEAARTAFDQLPEGTELPTVKELNAERIRLIQERQVEYAEYRKVKADRTEFIRAKQNADVILYKQVIENDEKQHVK